MMVVDMDEGAPSPFRSLIDPWPYLNTVGARSYEVLEDGAFITTMDEAELSADEEDRSGARQRNRIDEIQVVLNFFEVLRQRVAD